MPEMHLLGRLLLIVGMILGVTSAPQVGPPGGVPGGVPGGLGGEIAATNEVQQIIEEVKGEVLDHLGLAQVSRYEALTFKEQTVAGKNYFVKVALSESDEDDVVHVKIYQTLPFAGSQVSLTSLQRPKSPSDPITFF